MQVVSTHNLELDPAVTWRLVGIRRDSTLRREAPPVVPAVESSADRMPALDVRADARPHREWIGPGVGDAIEFAMFALTLAAIGYLQLHLALLS